MESVGELLHDWQTLETSNSSNSTGINGNSGMAQHKTVEGLIVSNSVVP